MEALRGRRKAPQGSRFGQRLAPKPAAHLCQAESMARGWESKSVESQMEEVADRHIAALPQRRPEELALERERESVELSRTRVLQDLAAANNPKYRQLLERSLSFLDEKLAGLRRS